MCKQTSGAGKAASTGADGPSIAGCCVRCYCRLIGVDKQAHSGNMFTKQKCCNDAFIPGVYAWLTVLVGIIWRHIWVSRSVPVGLMSIVPHLHRSGT